MHLDLAETDPEFGMALKRIIRSTNLFAVDALDSLLDSLLAHGTEFLLDDHDHIVDIFQKEWRGEMIAEVELQKLCVDSRSRKSNQNQALIPLSVNQ